MSSANLNKIRHNANVARKVINFQISEDESEARKKEKASAKAKQMADPAYIKQTKLNRIYQSKDKAETEAKARIARGCNELKSDLFNFLTKDIDEATTIVEIEQKVNCVLSLLKDLKVVSQNSAVREQTYSYNLAKSHDSRTASKSNTVFDRLFNELVDFDARFLLFAPKATFNRATTQPKINTLQESLKHDVKVRLEKLEADENADYVTEYIVCEFDESEKPKEVEEINLKFKQAKTSAVDVMEQAIDKMSADIATFIKEEYSEIQNVRQVTTKDIVELLNSTQRERKCLFDLIKDNEFVKARMSKRKMNAYDEMYNNIVNLDVKFALGAPRKVLGRLDLDFKVFNEKEKDVMFERICKMGLWDIPQYVENYHYVFACQIAKTNITNQA